MFIGVQGMQTTFSQEIKQRTNDMPVSLGHNNYLQFSDPCKTSMTVIKSKHDDLILLTTLW